MRTTKYFLTALLLLIVCCNFIACSKDDENSDTEKGYIYVEDEVDQLAYLQHNLVAIDEDGNFQYRSLGISLNPSDTTVVSVGVANLTEAKEIFANLFSKQTEVSSDGMHYTLPNGNTAWLAAETADGVVAVAYFDIPRLKHVSKVVFIELGAWPVNAETSNDYKLGEFYEEEGFCFKNPTLEYEINNAMVKYLCVREAAMGRPAILIGFSDKKYTSKVSALIATWDKHLLKVEDASLVYNIISDNKEIMKECFESIGVQALSEECYWIDGSAILYDEDDDFYKLSDFVRRVLNISTNTVLWNKISDNYYYLFCKKNS